VEVNGQGSEVFKKDLRTSAALASAKSLWAWRNQSVGLPRAEISGDIDFHPFAQDRLIDQAGIVTMQLQILGGSHQDIDRNTESPHLAIQPLRDLAAVRPLRYHPFVRLSPAATTVEQSSAG